MACSLLGMAQTDKCMEQSVLRMMTVIDLGRNIWERHSKPLKTPLRLADSEVL
jgi:isoleucyl-tRNA synthetase